MQIKIEGGRDITREYCVINKDTRVQLPCTWLDLDTVQVDDPDALIVSQPLGPAVIGGSRVKVIG